MSIDARFALPLGNFSIDIDTSIASEGVTALFGPSGAGKTSVLRCMAGLERAPHGKFRVDDEVWQDEAEGTFVPPHRRPVGVVFQNVGLFPHLTVEQNLVYGRKRARRTRGSTASALDVDDAGELLAIRHLLGRYPARLSGGEAQRVAIARSLVADPRLLLLDEPLTGLDAQSKAEVMDYLEGLLRELSLPVVYVSHSLEEVARLADAMAIMENGRITETGAPQELLARLDLPAAHSDAAGAVLETEVEGHDLDYRLTRLSFTGGQLVVPHRELEPGTPVRVRVQARDVSIALHQPTATSILNVLPARVTALEPESPGQVLVRLAVGDAALLARITRKSAESLDLRAGQTVYAQVKSVGLIR
ncbi:MAG: molybdenum ABC transporter ATP-binding protein [Candidatus Bipolaricaulia bacterium]